MNSTLLFPKVNLRNLSGGVLWTDTDAERYNNYLKVDADGKVWIAHPGTDTVFRNMDMQYDDIVNSTYWTELTKENSEAAVITNTLHTIGIFMNKSVTESTGVDGVTTETFSKAGFKFNIYEGSSAEGTPYLTVETDANGAIPRNSDGTYGTGDAAKHLFRGVEYTIQEVTNGMTNAGSNVCTFTVLFYTDEKGTLKTDVYRNTDYYNKYLREHPLKNMIVRGVPTFTKTATLDNGNLKDAVFGVYEKDASGSEKLVATMRYDDTVASATNGKFILSNTALNGTDAINASKTVTIGTSNNTVSYLGKTGATPAYSLLMGSYILREETVPAGYLSNVSDITLVIDESGKCKIGSNENGKTDVEIANTPYSLKIYKEDQFANDVTEATLSIVPVGTNARFADGTSNAITLTQNATANTTTVKWVPASENEKGYWDLTGILAAGTQYTVSETATPTNNFTASSVTFTMGADGKIIVAANGGATLHNAATAMTSVIGFTNLYQNASGNAILMRDVARTGDVELYKRDRASHTTGIANIYYKLYKCVGTTSDETNEPSTDQAVLGASDYFITDTDGNIKVSESNLTNVLTGQNLSYGLTPGTYYFVEQNRGAVDQYQLRSDKLYFTIAADDSTNVPSDTDKIKGTTTTYNASGVTEGDSDGVAEWSADATKGTVYNTKLQHTLMLNKIGLNDAALEGVTFTLKYEDTTDAGIVGGDTGKKTWNCITDAQGKLVIAQDSGDIYQTAGERPNISYIGNYVLTETKPLDGYLVPSVSGLDIPEFSFSVKAGTTFENLTLTKTELDNRFTQSSSWNTETGFSCKSYLRASEELTDSGLKNYPTSLTLNKVFSTSIPNATATLTITPESGSKFANVPEGKETSPITITYPLDSDSTDNVLEGKLIVDNIYSIQETVTSSGYTRISKKLGFSVGGTGFMYPTYLGADCASVENGKLEWKIGATTVGTLVPDEYGAMNTITITNQPVKATLKKTDSVTNTAIKGAEFTLSGTFVKVSDGDETADNFTIPVAMKSGEELLDTITLDETTLVKDQVAYRMIADPEIVYTLTETKAPLDYQLDDTAVTFTLDVAGNIEEITDTNKRLSVTADTATTLNTVLTFTNTPVVVNIKKTDMDGNAITNRGNASVRIEGEVLGSDGTTSNQSITETLTPNTEIVIGKASNVWLLTSSVTDKNVYKVTEDAAPAGYKTIATSYFIVNEDGTVTVTDVDGNALTGEQANKQLTFSSGVLQVRDEQNEVTFQKADAEGNLITSDTAAFTITDQNTEADADHFAGQTSNKVTSIDVTTNEGSVKVSGVLLAGHTYDVTEKQSPDGYAIADGILAVLAVAADGSITITSSNETHAAVAGTTLTVQDDYTKLYVKKEDATDPSIALNASFEITGTFYNTTTKANAADKAFTVATGTTGQVALDADTLTDDDGAYTLIAGNTYAFEETTTPTGYETVTAFSMKVSSDGSTWESTGSTNPEGVTILTQDGLGVLVVSDARTLGTVNVVKADANTNAALDGATYGLFAGEETTARYTSAAVTGTTGALQFTNVAWGTYTLKEISAPSYYTKSDATQTVTIDATHLTVSLTGINTEGENDGLAVLRDAQSPGSVTLKKVDSKTQAAITGAVFKLQKKDGTGYVDVSGSEKTTGTDGTVAWDMLTWGDYKVIESAPAPGYILGTSGTAPYKEFTVGASQIDYSFTAAENWVINDAISLTIKKGTTGSDSLSGLQLQLTGIFADDTTKATTKTETWTTAGGDWTLSAKLIVGNSYTLTELTAPAGYERFFGSISFTAKGDGTIELTDGTTIPMLHDGKTPAAVIDGNQVTLNNQKVAGDFTLTKYAKDAAGEETTTPVSGIEFTLYKGATLTDCTDENKYSAAENPYKTDEHGQIKITDLPAGDYVIVETAGSAEYHFVADTTYTTFTIRDKSETESGYDAGEHPTDTLYNDVFKSEIQLTKVDGTEADAAKLAGAEFTVTYKADAEAAAQTYGTTYTSAENTGLVQIPVDKKGIYTITETKAPTGYAIGTVSTWTVTITDEAYNKIVTTDDSNEALTIVNAPLKLKLHKFANDTDAQTRGALQPMTTPVTFHITGDFYGVESKTIETNVTVNATTDTNGQIDMAVWKASDEKEYRFVYGERYTMTEDAPAGYESTTGKEIKFTFNSDGKIDNSAEETRAFTSDTMTKGSLAGLNDAGDTILVYNDKVYGKVALTKYKVSAEAGNELAGVTFDLYKQNGDQPDTAADTKLNTEAMTTDAEGVITYAGLVTGTYYFVETGVDESYYLDATPLTFEVTNSDMFDDTDDDTVITVSKVNEELSANLTFQKYFTNEQNENRGIPNATFQLSYSTTEDGNYHDVEVITTDENGVGTNTEALKRGWYNLTELSAPGYVRTGSDDQLFSCHFEVKNVRSTDADGKTIPTVYEITNAADYIADANADALTADGIKNEPISLTLNKVDAANAATKLAATFTIAGEFVNIATGTLETKTFDVTTTNGTTKLDQSTLVDGEKTYSLEAGDSYTLTEKTRPAGYESIGEITFTVSADGKSIDTISANPTLSDGTTDAASKDGATLTVKNIKVENKVTLTKTETSATTGVTGPAIDGVIYSLYKIVGTAPDTDKDTLVADDLITADGGKIVYPAANSSDALLTEGKYYFVETATLENYILDATPVTFEITAAKGQYNLPNGETVSATNDLLNASLTFTKYDRTDAAMKVAGAKFEMKAYADSTKTGALLHTYEIVTNENGVATLTKYDNVAKSGVISLTKGYYELTEVDSATINGYKSTSDGKNFMANFTVTDACKNQTLTIKNDQLNAAPFKLTAATDVAAAFLQSEDTNSKDGIYDDRMLGTVTLLKAETDGTTGINQAQFTLEKKVVAENPWQAVKNFLTGNKYENVDATAVADTTTPGKLTIENLPWGDYRIKETKAADGYKLGDSQWHEFTIDKASGISKQFTYDQGIITNAKTDITIEKTDGTTLLAGANLALTGVFADSENGQSETRSWTSLDTEGKQFIKQLIVDKIYTLTETNRVPGYVQFDEAVTFKLNDDGNIVLVENPELADGRVAATAEADKLTLRNVKILAKAQMTKTTADGETPLEGVTFDVYEEGNTTPVETGLKTNAQGVITTKDLPEGTYYFKEAATLDNYALDQTEVPFEIGATDRNKVIEVTMNNEAFAYNVHLTKIDATSKAALAGVEFTLYEQDGQDWKSVEAKLSDDKGEITFNLNHKGTYKVTETKSVYGYDLEEQSAYTRTFVVDNTIANLNQTLELGSIENTRTLGIIRLTKQDAEDDAGIAGTEFTLFTDNEAKDVVQTKTTEADGTLIFTGIAWGKYYVQETKATDGYVLDDTTYPVEIGNTTETTLAEDLGVIKNDRSKITFNKVVLDRETSEIAQLTDEVDPTSYAVLAGATFGIYTDAAATVAVTDADGDAITAVSDADGLVTFDQMKVGTYYVKEIDSGAEKVIEHENAFKAVIEPDGTFNGLEETDDDAITSSTVLNDVLRGTVELLKVDEDDPTKVLPGSTYGLYRMRNVDFDAITGANKSGLRTMAEHVLSVFSADGASDEEVLVATATTDANGKLVFDNVLTGIRYTIRELTAPEGSQVSEKPISLEFKISEDGKAVIDTETFDMGDGTATIDENGNITWFEPPTKVEIQKKDTEGKLLAGATLRITNEDGTRVEGVEDWVSSDKEGHRIDGILVENRTYILTELSAPDGYAIADPIKFTISDKKVGPNEDFVQVWEMIDKKIPVTVTPTPDNKKPTGTTSITPVNTNAVQTGDTTAVYIWVVLGAAAMAAILAIIMKKKREEDEQQIMK
ncbi:MAG: SpaA isopeptide-forming pilin-related protein [Lachnospiraceae bacterium]|nr:SpaA isopeptide-forming pilin-related protein [Lachnospiraceae bacterium]MDD3617198.1 SpaA isopeptide-forming pilin-related protein [Lachnospiraceae bacterium]